MSKVIFEFTSPEENAEIKACFNSYELYKLVVRHKNNILTKIQELEGEKGQEDRIETLKEVYQELGELIIEEKLTDLF